MLKKPVEIKAVQWTGDNYDEILNFAGELNVEYHREVCGIKIEYLDLLSKLPEQVNNSNFAIKVSCRYHEDKPSIINRHCELY